MDLKIEVGDMVSLPDGWTTRLFKVLWVEGHPSNQILTLEHPWMKKSFRVSVNDSIRNGYPITVALKANLWGAVGTHTDYVSPLDDLTKPLEKETPMAIYQTVFDNESDQAGSALPLL